MGGAEGSDRQSGGQDFVDVKKKTKKMAEWAWRSSDNNVGWFSVECTSRERERDGQQWQWLVFVVVDVVVIGGNGGRGSYVVAVEEEVEEVEEVEEGVGGAFSRVT